MPNLLILGVLSCAIATAGCGARTAPLRVDARHPADPRALEAPVPLLVPLAPDAFDRAVVDEPAREPAGGGTMSPVEDRAMPSHHDHGPVTGQPGAGVPASPDSTSTHSRAPSSTVFVCPMHPEVTDVKASRCPKCGMTLVRRKGKP